MGGFVLCPEKLCPPKLACQRNLGVKHAESSVVRERARGHVAVGSLKSAGSVVRLA